ncbi:MAG: hypothetical protein HQ508_07855 [Candidatus Marinimicrobia bacterium]|nr:hypothetical protein [Candidatus Neomarinimicrobiota bacterium]
MKIKDLAEAALIAKYDIKFVILNSTKNHESENLKYIKVDFPSNKFIKAISQKLFRYKYIEKHVDMSGYDAVILRYPLAFGVGVTHFYRKYGNKIYTEHHTNEGAELRKIGSTKIIGIAFSLYEDFRKGAILKYCRGLIGVTDEIRRHEISFVPKIPSHTMSNGINVSRVRIAKRGGRDDNRLHIIFLAARFAPWHGLDYAILGIQKYIGDVPLTLHVVGNISNISQIMDFKNSSLAILIYHGELHNEQLDNLFDQIDIGISSLGIHRIGLHEASVLKTREYFARGIPFVYGYDDSDLTGNEPYGRRVHVQKKGYLDFDELVTMHDQVSVHPNLRVLMREQAKLKIDWQSKLSSLVNFVEKN